MADIGSTLRETRIRDKIDITVVEEATKIRAKYLRALENEEWAVLPGPTFVKSFLRTYAEFLGLDAHMLVEEYRVRYEHPEELELPAFAESRGPLRTRVRPPGPPSRAVAITALALGFLALLFVLGITAGDENGGSGDSGDAGDTGTPSRSSGGGSGETGATDGGTATERNAKETSPVRVSVVAARAVWVCMVDAKGESVIGGRTIAGGQTEGPFRSKRFRLTVGNGGADLRINGRDRNLPETSEPHGYAISGGGVRDLAVARRPTCGPGT